MKNLPLLAIFTGVLICSMTSPLFSFAEESKTFSSEYLSEAEVKKSIAEYCQDSPYKNSSYSVISDEEYAVYAALFENFFQTAIGVNPFSIAKKILPICEGDSQEYFLKRKIPTYLTVNLVGNRRFDWEGKPEKYWMGTFQFSRVTFNKKQSRAFIRVVYSCGLDCGFSEIYVFKNYHGQWKFLQTGKMVYI